VLEADAWAMAIGLAQVWPHQPVAAWQAHLALRWPTVRSGYRLIDIPTGLRLSKPGYRPAPRPVGWTPPTHPSMLHLEVTLDPADPTDRQVLLDVLDQLYFAAMYFQTDVMVEFRGTTTRPQPRLTSQEWRVLA